MGIGGCRHVSARRVHPKADAEDLQAFGEEFAERVSQAVKEDRGERTRKWKRRGMKWRRSRSSARSPTSADRATGHFGSGVGGQEHGVAEPAGPPLTILLLARGVLRGARFGGGPGGAEGEPLCPPRASDCERGPGGVRGTLALAVFYTAAVRCDRATRAGQCAAGRALTNRHSQNRSV